METIEKSRKKALLVVVASTMGSIVLYFGVIYGFLYSKLGFIPIWFGFDMMIEVLTPFIMACGLSYETIKIISGKAIKKYKEDYFNNFVIHEFEKEFHDIKTDIKGISKVEVTKANLIESGNTVLSNDKISGTYRGLKFNKADVTVQEEHTDSDGTTTTIIVFQGQWIVIDGLEKAVNQVFIVNGKLITPQRKYWFKESEFETVDTESIDFNKVFKVHAKNAHDAFYFLSPPMMERFLSYPRSNGFGVSVKGYKAYIAIDSRKDSLKASLFRKVALIDYQQVRDDVDTIKQTIDIILDEDR